MKKKQTIIQKAFGSLVKAFRGTIWEDALTYKLHGKAYESIPIEQNGHFWIKSARHLAGPLQALNDPLVRKVFIIGATQVLKTVAGDLWTIFVMVHAPRNMLVLFETDKKAKEFCDIRIMEVIKRHPVLARQIGDADRHDVTKTYIKLAGMDLMAAGLNDSNLSTFSWPYIRVSESWQTGKNGMLRKAIRRADRFPDNCKILIESQAGPHGDDLHTESSAAHQVSLFWNCPFCAGRQTWECTHEYGSQRPADFVPLPANPPVAEPPKPGSYSGMKFPAEGTIEERARLAVWECYHCGTQIEDTEKNRMAIMDSYQQEYRIQQPDGTWITPKEVCFIMPREAMWNNTFESGVKSYLAAKDSQSQGNDIPLANWFMSERAVFYSPTLSTVRVPVITGSPVDPENFIPNEAFRDLKVDCQKDLIESLKQGKEVTGHFWWIADAVDKQGNTFQIGRGYATSWEELFGTVVFKPDEKGVMRRIIEGGIKNRLKIPTRNVAIDGGHWFDIVKEKAAQYRTVEDALDGSGKKVWGTWQIMLGDDLKGWRHEDKIYRSYSPVQNNPVMINEGDGWKSINVRSIRWSNFAVKSQLQILRIGSPGKPKFVALEISQCDKKTQEKEVGNFTYENQMDGEILGVERGKPKFLPIHKEQHYKDCTCMGIVTKSMAGLIGHVAAPDEDAQEAS